MDNLDLKPKMRPNSPEKLATGRTFLIGLGFFSASVAWAYFNFTVPLILRGILPDKTFLSFMGRDTLIGFIMTFDNIIAVILQPYFGALSDRNASKYGRRIPFMIIGCTVGAFFFSLIPHLQVIGSLILVILCFNFAMAFYRAPIVSLMPDITPKPVRSTGNAIINLMGGVATIFAYGTPLIAGMLFGEDTDTQVRDSRIFGFSFLAIMMIIALIVLFLTVKDTPTGTKFFEIVDTSFSIDPITLEHINSDLVEDEGETEGRETLSKWDDLKDVFRMKEKSLLWMLFAIFFWFFGYNAIEAFYSSFATEYLGWKESEASTVLLLLPMSFILAAYPAGKLAEKIGRRKTMKIGLIGVIICVLLITFAREKVVIALFLAIVGMFWSLVNVNSIAVVWELAPEGKSGAYTGVYYTFSQLAAILSPIFAGLVFDAYKAVNSTSNSGKQYILLFPYVLIWMVIALICLMKVKLGDGTNIQYEKPKED